MLEGFTISSSNPPEHLSKDGECVVVGGLKWFPKGDFMSINYNEQYAGEQYAGNHPGKYNYVGKVAEIFDLSGRVIPLVSGMKLDIHELLTKVRLG